MYKKVSLYSFIIALVVFPGVASANAILRTGDTVSIANDQIVDGDFYALGETVSLSGVVSGDVYTLAGSFTGNGQIENDLTVVGGSVQIHASVTDDVRVVGGEVVVAGPVEGDVVVVGGLLKILSTASVKGDILFFGGELQVLGPVDGSIMGTADRVRIDAHVGQSIDMKVGSMTLGDRAEILGDVRYLAVDELTRSQSAVVVGEIVKNSLTREDPVQTENIIVTFIIFLFSALVLQLLFRAKLFSVLPRMTSNLGMAGLIGMAAFILAPIVIIIALASMLGTLIGLVLLSGFLLVIFVSLAMSSILVGSTLGRLMKKDHSVSVVHTILGALVLQILLFIPIVGPTLLIVVLFVVLGSIVRELYFSFRS